MGHLGFSYVGLIYLLLLFIPNTIWSKKRPTAHKERENKILLLFERIGQACCTCSVLLFIDFNVAPFSAWSFWLIASAGILGIGHMGIHIQHLKAMK